jgi:hypothetical protein
MEIETTTAPAAGIEQTRETSRAVGKEAPRQTTTGTMAPSMVTVTPVM